MQSYLETLNAKQLEAVKYRGNSLLILAGAGSGKTRVITTKIAYLMEYEGFHPHEILAVTFTNKAAAEMRERLFSMSDLADQVMIRTFHSFGAWLLRRNGSALSLNSNFTIYDDDDSLSLLHSLFQSRYKKTDLKKYIKYISLAKDYAIPVEGDLGQISSDPEFAIMYKAYTKRLHEIGNLDFGDLIFRCIELLQKEPAILDRIRNRFRVILVDEFQDSNVAQFELLKLMTAPQTALCVVGDDDQSIYGFRGAEVQNILQFPNRFPGTEVIRLEQNYRSTENILHIASEVVSNNSDRLGKTLWSDLGVGKKPVLAYLQDQEEEAEYCVELLRDGRLEETAILYRTNAQSASFETAFLREGIPYKIVGALRFYERAEIKDALAILAMFQNPRDEIAVRRIINKPARGIGKSSIEKIIQAAIDQGCSIMESAPSLSGKAKKSYEAFCETYQKLENQIEKLDLPDFLDHCLIDFEIKEFYRKEDEISASSKLRNLEELLSAAANYPKGREGLSQFLEDLELDRSRMAENDSQNGVTLITMHNTKGLEFERVIITGMEDGLFPSNRDDNIEEERRIFYVSITRAKKELYFICCKARRIWGQRKWASPSPFLSELPKDELEVFGAAEEPASEYKKGMRVFQEDFGEGYVFKVVDNGRDLLIMVQFDSGRTAQFFPKYTDLEILRSDDDW
jgi:DNA helicase-2/ATP-dependent DNA helicase PcrA